MAQFSDNQQQYDQDDFVVEISLFDEFDDEDEQDVIPVSSENRVLH